MENLRLEEENIITDKKYYKKNYNNIRNIFRLKKKQNYTAIKDTRNLFRQEKEIKTIIHRILRDIKNILENKRKK